MTFSNTRKIHIDYDASNIQNMLDMLKAAPFPDRAPIDTKEPWDLGIGFEYLKQLKSKMETEWMWAELRERINRFDNFLVDYASVDGVDELELHFVHVRSKRTDAIPLMLMHGWPGTFHDFHKVVEPLVNPPTPNDPAFHVVIPSLPGFFKSTLSRRDGWNLIDTAKLYDGLMTDVLGYKKYVAQGGDWGALILRVMSYLHSESVIAAHFNMFVGAPRATDESKLSVVEKRNYERYDEFLATGQGYLAIQRTKPFTIGLAIASSPLAILAYIGEKIYVCSDPSLVNVNFIIDTAALYFLSGSFATSVFIYNQHALKAAKQGEGDLNTPLASFGWPVKSAFGFSHFESSLPHQSESTKEGLEKFGPLSFYNAHGKGGHFPALDCPQEFVDDLREFFSKNPV